MGSLKPPPQPPGAAGATNRPFSSLSGGHYNPGAAGVLARLQHYGPDGYPVRSLCLWADLQIRRRASPSRPPPGKTGAVEQAGSRGGGGIWVFHRAVPAGFLPAPMTKQLQRQPPPRWRGAAAAGRRIDKCLRGPGGDAQGKAGAVRLLAARPLPVPGLAPASAPSALRPEPRRRKVRAFGRRTRALPSRPRGWHGGRALRGRRNGEPHPPLGLRSERWAGQVTAAGAAPAPLPSRLAHLAR